MNNLKATTPQNISYTDSKLKIEWLDGHKSEWNLLALRKRCPCAVCRGGDFGKIGTMTTHITTAKIISYKKMGRYALTILWGDAHETGIYTWDNLRESCECSECGKQAPTTT